MRNSAGRARAQRGSASALALVLVLVVVTSACTSSGGSGKSPAGTGPSAVAAEPELPPAEGTVVSLTFDQGAASQYRWARPLLRQHGLHATFFVPTARVDSVNGCCLTWQQAQQLHREGDEIGAFAQDGRDLTLPASPDPEEDYAEKRRQVCGAHDRLAELGLDPRSFAYPAGAHAYSFPVRSLTLTDLVASCGYLSGRIVGGLSEGVRPSSVPRNPLPPTDPYVVRTPDEDSTSPVTLAALQEAVTSGSGAGAHWVPLVFAEVCHPGDPSFRACMSTRRAIDDTVLSAFLSWLADAGQPGGAPQDVTVRTVRQVMGAPAPAPLPPPRTVVSLTFDDADRTQALAGAALEAHHVHGTFYVNSGPVDAENPQHLTWAQIIRLRQDGNDIGGHTLSHVDLTDPGLTDATRRGEVCDDRRRLQQLGMDPVSFAYPYGASTPAVAELVASCGYLSGRSAGGVSDDVPAPETIPPSDALAMRAQRSPDGPWTLPALQQAVVSAADNGGGWLQLQFHRVCPPDDPAFATCMSGTAPVDAETFTAFVDWLVSDAPVGTSVQTVRAVMTTSR